MRTSKFKRRLSLSVSALIILIVIIVSINIISSKLYSRIDITDGDIYSLSAGSKKVVSKLDDQVVIKFYFSRSLRDIPPAIKTYATRVEEVLGEYVAMSKGKMRLEVYDPKPDTDEEEWARKYDISGVRLPDGDNLYFGVVLVKGVKEIVIKYLDPRREEFLEYDISEALLQTAQKDRQKIAIMSTLPVMGPGVNAPPYFNNQGQAWAFVEFLRRNFDVEEIKTDAQTIDNANKLLLIIHPKDLKDETLYAIDQFLLRGGRLIVAVDPFSRYELQEKAQSMQMGQVPQVSSDFDKLFSVWSIEAQKGQFVGDLKTMIQVNSNGSIVPYPFFMILSGDLMNKDSIITGRLNQIMYAEGTSFKIKEGSSYQYETLLKTTKDSGLVSAGMATLMGPADLTQQLKVGNEQHNLALLIRGKFKSAFPGGLSIDPNKSTLNNQHLDEAQNESMIVVIGDTDFLYDANAVEKFQFGPQVMSRLRNDNLNFLFNAVEYLSGSEDLIAIRSKGKISRPFTKLQDIQKDAQLRWKEEEEKLTARIQELQRKLSELESQKAEGSHLALSSQQQEEIQKFREEEAQTKRRRREVRKNLREDIESLGHTLITLNMTIIPLGVGVFGFSIFINRMRKMKRGRGRS